MTAPDHEHLLPRHPHRASIARAARQRPSGLLKCLPRVGIILSLALSVILLSGGCAYYNTFYNAKQEFKRAEKERKKRKTDKPSAQENSAYSKAIEKASKVLELYSDSKYVDDALLMLGKCFYFKGEYSKAERKFEELLSLYGEGDLAEQALLWRAKTRVELKKYDEAAADCRRMLNTTKDHKLREEAQYLFGKISFAREEYRSAASEFATASRETGDKYIKSQAFFQLGECHLKLRDYGAAALAFQGAAQNAESDDFRYRSLLKMGEAQKFQGLLDEAIKTFRKVLNEELAKEYWPDTKLQVAETINLKGEMDDSIEWYESIIEDHPKTDAAARSHYALGQIHEQHIGDYEKAKEEYNLAQKESPRSEIVPLATAKSNDIAKLLGLKAAIARFRGDVAQSDSLEQPDAVEPDSLAEPSDLVDADLTALASDTSTAESTIPPQFLRSGSKSQTGQAQSNKQILLNAPPDLGSALLQLGELYYFQLSKPDSALEQYWAAYETQPDSTIGVQALYSIAFLVKRAFQDTLLADSLLTVIVERFPDSPQADGARRQLGLPMEHDEEMEVADLFCEAESASWDNGEYEQAAVLFGNITQSYPDSKYAPKALFARGWILENRLHDSQRAHETYSQLVESYPESEFATKIKKKLDAVEKKEQAEKEATAASADSTVSLPADSLVSLPTDSLAASADTTVVTHSDSLAVQQVQRPEVTEQLAGEAEQQRKQGPESLVRPTTPDTLGQENPPPEQAKPQTGATPEKPKRERP